MLNASSNQTFTYSDYLNNTDKNVQNIDKLRPPEIDESFAHYTSNMNLIAEIPSTFEGIRVYNEEGQLVGESFAQDQSKNGFKAIYATIYGEAIEKYKVLLIDKEGKEAATSTTLTFVADAIYGTLKTPVIITEDLLIKSTFLTSPNPFVNSVTVSFNATTSGKGILYVFDMNNRELTSEDLIINQGENTKEILIGNVPIGTYILQLHFNDVIYSKILIKQ